MLAELCLAAAIWHEARGESLHGQHMVAAVVMNRANGDSRKVCKVVYAKGQFSGIGYGGTGKSWLAAVNTAKEVLHGRGKVHHSYKYFCNCRHVGKRVGRHVFW